MVKVTLVTLLMVTIVNIPMVSLVVLVVALVNISFANTRINVIAQFAQFIGKNFGLTFPRHEKKPSPPFIAEVSANSIANHASPTLNPLAIKHGICHGSHMNKPAWQISDTRPRFFAITVLLSYISSSNQKLMPISINNSLSSVHLTISLMLDEENKTRMLVDTDAAMIKQEIWTIISE